MTSAEDSDIIKEVLSRADAANIKYDRITEDETTGLGRSVRLNIASGSNFRSIHIYNDEMAQSVLSADFQNLSFIDGYDALLKNDSGEIEAAITTRDNIPTSAITRYLGLEYKFTFDSSDRGINGVISCSNSSGIKIEISQHSDQLAALIFTRSQTPLALSLKITLPGSLGHNRSKALLEKISDSIFFQIDLERGVTLSLRTQPRPPRQIRRSHNQNADTNDIEFPKFEYEKAPISLYWYGRSARRMPLLQFLAYYQVVEYYFPMFSMTQARSDARRVLKNPSFRVERDADITKLVQAISRYNKGGANEREQLRYTITALMSNEELIEFLRANSNVAQAIEKKQRGVTDKTINLNRKDADNHDHRNDLADLLYDIRCKIVHTKSDGGTSGSDLILPYTEAEHGLSANIFLMEYVAQNALIRGSATLDLDDMIRNIGP